MTQDDENPDPVSGTGTKNVNILIRHVNCYHQNACFMFNTVQ